MKRRSLAVAVALMVSCLGCATQKTSLSNVWFDAAAQRPMQKILVIGIGESDARRRGFEDRFVAALTERGSAASASYELLPGSDRLTRPEIEKAIDGRGFDGVIVTRLLGVDTDETYVPPTTYVTPGYYGGGLYPYYNRSIDVVQQPGYTISTTVVRLETHVYAAATAELVWAAHSETLDPDSIDEIFDSVTARLCGRLAADGLIRAVEEPGTDG